MNRELIEKWEKYKLQLLLDKEETLVMEDADEYYHQIIDARIEIVNNIITDLKNI
jgi:hypothetical protein